MVNEPDDRWDDRDDRDRSDDRDPDFRDDRRDLEEARSKVKIPAIFLMIVSGLSLIGIALNALQYVFTMPAQFEAEKRKIDDNPNMAPPAKKDMKEILDVYEKIVMTAMPIDWVVVAFTSLLIFVGAVKMKNLSSPGWARASAILSMIPCLSGCCLLGLPIGIWALVVLSNPDVKRAFQLTSAAPNRDDEIR